jgi:hypothetical protein
MKPHVSCTLFSIAIASCAAQEGVTRPDPKVETQHAAGDGGTIVQKAQAGAPAPQTDADFEIKMGNDWFEVTRKHLGTFFQEEEAVGKFQFKNPRDVGHRFTALQQSCTCSKALLRLGERQYLLTNDPQNGSIWLLRKKADGSEERERVAFVTVGPGEEGEFEVHMTIAGIQGNKDASIDVQTNDEKLPAVKLQWRATGATYFTIEPPEWHLNDMTWTDKREFQFEVSSPLQKDFNLISHDPLPKKMEVKYEKQMRGDKAYWIVKGTYGPGVDERDGGGAITFHSDVKAKTVTMRVSAMIKGPLELKPGGFLNLGVIRAGKGGEGRITLIPAGDFDLQVTKLEAERVSIAADVVQFAHHKQGKEVLVDIKIAPEVKKDQIVRGLLKIHLNHPASPVKEVHFTGFVR